MKRFVITFFLLTTLVVAEDKKPVAPTLTDAQKVEIKEKQIEWAEQALQLENLKKQYETQQQQIQQKQNQAAQELNQLLLKAQESVDKDQKTWKLNGRTLVFEPVMPPQPEKK